MHASGEHISLETEIPFEGEHISLTVYTEEHISEGRGQGYVCGETHQHQLGGLTAIGPFKNFTSLTDTCDFFKDWGKAKANVYTIIMKNSIAMPCNMCAIYTRQACSQTEQYKQFCHSMYDC